MSKTHSVAEALAELLVQQDRPYAWLSRESGVEYKQVLRQVKHREQPLTLENTIAFADVFGLTLPELVSKGRA